MQTVKQRRLPGDEQLYISGKGTGHIGQLAMLGIDLPGAHARQQGAAKGDAAITIVGRIEIFEPFCRHRDAGRREIGVAHHEQHLLRIGAQICGLLVKAFAQGHRLVEHRLRRCAPFVDRLLRPLAVPDAARLKTGHIVIGQFLPGACFVQVQSRVEQGSLELDEAGHAGHHLARAAVVKERAESHQRIAERIVTRERLHRRPRAAVGRAQHQQAATFARHQALPGFRPFQPHGACEQAAHGMCEQPHRLVAAATRTQGIIHRIGQPPSLVFQRTPPIKSERDDFMRIGQALNEIVVHAADGAIGLHL